LRLTVSRVATCLLLGMALPVGAQQPGGSPQQPTGIPLVPGSRVRVTATTLVAPLVANYLSLRGDTLMLFEEQAGRGVWSVTLDQVRKLETTVGMKTGHGPYIMRGAMIGAGAGAVGGLVFAASAKPSDPTRKYSRPLSMLVGMGAGALVGGFIGSRFKVEKWAPVPLPAHGDAEPGRSSLASFSLRF
jgi:hypothetical protein